MKKINAGPLDLPKVECAPKVLMLFNHNAIHAGQFWNTPASISPFDGRLRDGRPITNRYLVNITQAGQSRGLIGIYYPQNWQGDAQPCMYVGDRQAGPNYSIADYDGGVVEGTFDDYEVQGPLTEGNYKFGLFEKDKC